ncbi:PadR family transcriptional regulator [Microbacterium sp.]|uniref:PadR family transcriptional regulator n=1 Tax=Microbacterium sp. TaxID=51671 RepID=UPI0039E2B499
MQAAHLRTALSVVVLGMVSEEQLHPYAMRRRIEERAYDRLPGVKVSSLYDVVRRLAVEDLIRANEPARTGNRPERTTFAITPAGLEALLSWIEHTLADDADPDGLPAALSFMYSLGRDRAVTVLRAREQRMTEAIDADERALTCAVSVNPIFVSEHRYQLARRRAERDWLAGFLAELDSGTLDWPQ